MSPEEIGAELRRRRKWLRLTQLDVAELVGVNRRTISEVERGTASITLRNLIPICDALGIDLVLQRRYPGAGP